MNCSLEGRQDEIKKVAILADGIFPAVVGGMQMHSYYIVKYLARSGVQVDLFTMVWNEEDLNVSTPFTKEELKNIKIQTFIFPKSIGFPGHYLYNSYRLSVRMYRALKQSAGNYDFIYTKGFMGWYILRNQSDFQYCKIGVKFHGMNMFLPTKGAKQRIEQLLLRPPTKWILDKADVVFSYGGKVTETILKVGINRSKIVEVPTGIEETWLRDCIKSTTNSRRIVFIGRNDPVKGIRELRIAISKTSQKNLEFDIVGPLEGIFLDIGPNVKCHGEVLNKESLIKILDNADALILPSYSEGMPNVLLEAMSRGLIILSSNVGAVEMLVDDNGILIDKVTTQNIVALLDGFQQKSDMEIDTMKRRSLEKVKTDYLWPKVSERLIENILKEIKKEHP